MDYQPFTFSCLMTQGFVKGEKFCFGYLDFYFRHDDGESTSTANQLTSPASQKSKDLNKVLLLLQDLGCNNIPEILVYNNFKLDCVAK